MRLLPLLGNGRRVAERLGIIGAASAPLLAAPATPTLTLTTGATDNTPGFQIDGALIELDTVRFQYSTDSGFAGTSEITNAIDAAEDAANQLTFSTGALADNTWYFRARIERPGHANSAWSNTETETIDTTAPTLSSPTGVKTGETTASATVDTNEANGTLYRVTDTGSTPSAAQVKAGQGSGGSAANGQAANAAVVATGTRTLNATGLTAATTYKHYWMHEDAVGNQSTVSASASFTTDASSEEAETTAWVNAVVAAGGTVSATQRTRVNTLIAGLKTDSIWTTLDQLWLWGHESVAQQATIDLKSLTVGTAVAGLALGAGGYTGNGSSRYFNPAFNPTTFGGNYTRNSAGIGVYIRTSSTTQANTERALGAVGTASTVLIPFAGFGGGSATYGVNATSTPTPANTNRQGLWHLNRSSSAAIQLYKNGSLFDSSADTSIAPDNLPFYFFANGKAGPAAENFLPDQMAAGWIASSWDATKAGNFATRLETYMDAWAIGIIP